MNTNRPPLPPLPLLPPLAPGPPRPRPPPNHVGAFQPRMMPDMSIPPPGFPPPHAQPLPPVHPHYPMPYYTPPPYYPVAAPHPPMHPYMMGSVPPMNVPPPVYGAPPPLPSMTSKPKDSLMSVESELEANVKRFISENKRNVRGSKPGDRGSERGEDFQRSRSERSWRNNSGVRRDSRTSRRTLSRSRSRSRSRDRDRERDRDRGDRYRDRRDRDRHRYRSDREIDHRSSQSKDSVGLDRDGRYSRPGSARPSLSPERRPTRRAFEKESEEEKEKRVKDHMMLTPDQILAREKEIWTRSAPADLYYQRDPQKPLILNATPRLQTLLDRFEKELIVRAAEAQNNHPNYQPFKLPRHEVIKCRVGRGCCGGPVDGDSSGSEPEDEQEEDKRKTKGIAKNETLEFMKNRQDQPYRLHQELWDNQPGELNDGPACRCSLKARKFGIRHGIYQGEDELPSVDLNPLSNNGDKLHHYRVTISPPTNFLVKNPTTINHDGHDFIFEGFSLFATEPLKTSELPPCHVVRFSIKYSVLYFEEKMPDNVTVRELELFHSYFFDQLLELHDFDCGGKSRFMFMPRFVRDLPENGKEILSMNKVMSYMLECGTTPLIDDVELMPVVNMPRLEWENEFVEKVRGQLVTNPGMKPAALRVDQLDREQDEESVIKYPDIVHFGNCPPQLCYASNSDYLKGWRDCVKFRHLLANMPKPTIQDRQKLQDMEANLNELKAKIKMKRDVAVAISSQGFYRTGLMTDIVQHGLLLPVLIGHLRFHASLDYFEKQIQYNFKNRHLLQLAMTHPSYKEHFGTNPDHARNALSHCGIRQPEFGDKKVHTSGNRKRGINMLISIMSKFGKDRETESKVGHNERLEFLGDAVVEFVTSVHLYHIFPDLEEGGLATYRAALVQNQHLAVLAEKIGLEKYMLYAHGNDLCHDAELRHAMANCFEALMGAIFLDGGIDEADKILTNALFGGKNDDVELHNVWTELPLHPLQQQEPDGDRDWIKSYPLLQKLVDLEKTTGIEFNHIRLLARALSDRSLSNCNLTMGSNQRLEFLGDTVLQLVSSEYLYKFFPEHHEGHLSLLRSSIVNNRTQSIVCDDLGLPNFAMYSNPKKEMKLKDRADLLEAYIGALYVDKDLEYCKVFAEVCFFPRLYQFIINQEWNDPKSKLQQCCLTLRTMDRGEPDIPVYKVISCKGPTNSRIYTVAVYFRGERLADAEGASIQQAEMNAATIALDECSHLFPHLDHQRRIMEKSFRCQGKDLKKMIWEEEVKQKRKQLKLDEINEENSKRNEEIIKRNLEQRQQRIEEERLQLKRRAEQNVVANHQCDMPSTSSTSHSKVPKSVVTKNDVKEEGELTDDEDHNDVNRSSKGLVDYESISSPEVDI